MEKENHAEIEFVKLKNNYERLVFILQLKAEQSEFEGKQGWKK